VNENDLDPARANAPLDDDAIARLLGDAGARPPIPREDLDAIAGAARAAWRARERERAGRAGSGGAARATSAGATPSSAAMTRRRPPRAIAGLALAAGLMALFFGTRAWWHARDAGPPAAVPAAPARVAVVVASTTSLRVEEGGVERIVAAGEAIIAGTIVHGASTATGATDASSASATLRLESGAEIRLDAGASARLASPTRIDLLGGALYADTDPEATLGAATRHGPAPRLEIHTAAGVARDIGTRFMARLVAGGSAPTLEVLVRDGAVAVERDSDSMIANTGEQITARAGAPIERVAAPTWGPEWAWVVDAATPLEVGGRSVADMLNWVARETGYTVRYEDAALAEAARATILQASREQTTMRPDQAPFVLLPANLEGEVEAGVLTVRRQRVR
jgi:hypothetical protein